MTFPDDVRYTKEHEWGRVDGSRMWTGITDYAQQELGDVVFVEFQSVGTRLKRGDSFGTVESVKAVSDLYAPVSGTILEVNKALEETPELVNQDCYGKAWMIIMEMDDPSEVESLWDNRSYEQFVSAETK
jgi:glycine cleavage system H protein